MRKVSEVLISALESFGPNGEHWCQKKLYSGNSIETAGEFCAVGAIQRDIILHKTEAGVYSSALTAFKMGPMDIVSINDRAQTNFGVVKALFCGAIKTAAEREAQAEDTKDEDGNTNLLA